MTIIWCVFRKKLKKLTRLNPTTGSPKDKKDEVKSEVFTDAETDVSEESTDNNATAANAQTEGAAVLEPKTDVQTDAEADKKKLTKS